MDRYVVVEGGDLRVFVSHFGAESTAPLGDYGNDCTVKSVEVVRLEPLGSHYWAQTDAVQDLVGVCTPDS